MTSGAARVSDDLFTDEAALDRLKEVWVDLWARTTPVPPMLEYAWVRTWWRLHRQEGRLFVLLVKGADGRPIGLAPLYLRHEGLRDPRRCLRTVAFLGTGERERDEVTGEYTTWLGPPAALPRVTERVAERLRGARADWDRLRLERMAAESGIPEDLALRLAGETLHLERQQVAAFRSAVQPLEQYLQALPSGNFRHRCRRALRAGREEGVEFVRARDPAEVRAMFAVLRQLHQQRWGDKGERGVFASPLFTRFQEAMIDQYGRQERLWMVGLRKGERWLALRYLLRAGDRLYDYISGVDTGTSTALAPGLLLHLLTLEACGPAGIRVYDLMAGDYDYKRKLAAEESQLPTLDLFGRTMRSGLWLTAREMGRTLKAVRGHLRTRRAGSSGAEVGVTPGADAGAPP